MDLSRISRYGAAEDVLGVLLRRVSGLWRRELNSALAEIDLTEMQFVVLMALAWKSNTQKRITQGELAEHARVSKALLSQILKSLTRKSLVRQTTRNGDSRVKELTLTKSGEGKVKEAVRILQTTEDAFWSDMPALTKDLKTILLAILKRKTPPLAARDPVS